MHRSTHILLIIALLLQAGGMVLIYQAGLWNHRAEVKTHILGAQHSTMQLKLTPSQLLQYTAGDGELRIGDRFYDETARRFDSGYWIISVINDMDEETLVSGIHQYENRHGSNSIPRFLLDFLDLYYVIPGVFQLRFFPSPKVVSYPVVSCSVLFGIQMPAMPPPWLFIG
jgi:hypothetical protein